MECPQQPADAPLPLARKLINGIALGRAFQGSCQCQRRSDLQAGALASSAGPEAQG
jgi:hypothetical protein